MAHGLHAHLHERKGDAGPAADAWLRTLELTPADGAAAVGAQRCLSAAGRIAELEPALRAAVKADPKSLPAHAVLIRHLLDKRSPGEALRQLEAAEVFLGGHPLLRILHAERRLQSGEKEEALAIARSIAAAVPEFPDVIALCARVLREAGKDDESFALMEKSCTASMKHADLLSDFGFSLIHRRQHTRALPVLERAVAANPSYRLAWENLAIAHRLSGNEAEALRCDAVAAKLIKPQMDGR